MTWYPTWWQWVLVYSIAGVLVWLLAAPVMMAGETVRDAIGRRSPWSERKRAANRATERVHRYDSGECYCPVHGWMLKTEADEHTRRFHADRSTSAASQSNPT